MRETGVLFDESAVPNGDQLETTDAVCSRLAADRYLIAGREIGFPVRVGAASMLLNTFIVNADHAATMIRGSGFRPLTLWPGKALLQLLAVDYRQNDLGDYNEGAIIFPVLTPGQKILPLIGPMIGMARGSIGNFIYRMPVNQPLTTHAGRYIWGFPKWVTGMEIEFGERAASGCFSDDGQLVYRIRAAADGKGAIRDQRLPSLAIRSGKAWKTYGVSNADGVTFRLGGAVPEIGDSHPLALELRALGLPKKPLFTVSARKMQMEFSGPEAVSVGQPFRT